MDSSAPSGNHTIHVSPSVHYPSTGIIPWLTTAVCRTGKSVRIVSGAFVCVWISHGSRRWILTQSDVFAEKSADYSKQNVQNEKHFFIK